MAEPDGVVDFEDRRKESYWERLDRIETECQRGHRDLRKDLRAFIAENDEALELMRDASNTLRSRIEVLENTPPDVAKLRFSTGVVVSIIFVTVSIAGTGYGVGSLVMGKIDALSVRMDQAAAAQKAEREATTKLQDERAARLASDITAIKAQSTMQDLKITNLREMLISKGK